MANRPSGQDLILQTIAQRVRSKFLALEPGSEHSSMWGTFKDIVRMPGSFIEEEVDSILESNIELELDRLPAIVVSGLWFSTVQANALLFEVQWAYDHGTALDSAIVDSDESDHRQHLVEHIRQLLASIAEQESMYEAG